MKAKTLLKLVAGAGAILIASANLASAGQGGKVVATISMAPDLRVSMSPGSAASFQVTPVSLRSRDFGKAWVANKCALPDGSETQAYQAVQWNGTSGTAGPFVQPDAVSSCVAYVWLIPDPTTPVAGGSMTYVVG